ncbi:hypothetical protein [Sphingomonas humi]|uniref:Secreted protein n=1 Tax=Sphingomonas humi TaxID=335630 RepID=A0ABP7RKZ1_9SPHN
MLLTLLSLTLAAQDAPAAAKPKMVCRSEVATGTRVNRKRICATKEQWDARRQEQIDSAVMDRANAERSRPCTGVPCR